jgi:hypothetical protein
VPALVWAPAPQDRIDGEAMAYQDHTSLLHSLASMFMYLVAMWVGAERPRGGRRELGIGALGLVVEQRAGGWAAAPHSVVWAPGHSSCKQSSAQLACL